MVVKLGGRRSACPLASVLQTELVEGGGRVPVATVANHGVEDREELPHARDLGNLGWFSLGSEAVVEESDDGIPTRGDIVEGD